MNSPQQPNPQTSMMNAMALGQQQSAANLQAAQQQQQMNMVNQSTPYGSVQYQHDPNSPSGYSANQTLSAPLQNILNSSEQLSQGAVDTGNNLLANQGGALGQGVDLSYGADANRIAQLEQQTLDPQWQRNQNNFDQTMANRGVMPGSAAYDNASRDFNTSRSDAYNNMFLGAYNTANNAATQQYNTNLNGMNALRSGGQVAAPVSSMGFTSTPQSQVQAPDITGAYQSSMNNQQNAYNNQLQQNNATMGGLFGLGGSILGAAGGPLGSAASFGLGLSSPFPSSYSGY